MKKALAVMMAMLFLFFHLFPAAQAEEKKDGMGIIADTVVVRPIGLASMGLGLVGFILTLPFSAATGTTEEVSKALVEEPARFTFSRPPGEFEKY